MKDAIVMGRIWSFLVILSTVLLLSACTTSQAAGQASVLDPSPSAITHLPVIVQPTIVETVAPSITLQPTSKTAAPSVTLQSSTTETLEASITPTLTGSDVVQGSVVLEDGRCCVGGEAGSEVTIRADFSASSEQGQVNEMRVSTKSGCAKESDLAEIAWEPFEAQRSFTTRAASGWVGFYLSVQFRDSNGNLSPVFCDDISVEGMPARP